MIDGFILEKLHLHFILDLLLNILTIYVNSYYNILGTVTLYEAIDNNEQD
jgi:hypothetical protein